MNARLIFRPRTYLSDTDNYMDDEYHREVKECMPALNCSAVSCANSYNSCKSSIRANDNHVQTSPDVLTVSGHTDLYTDWSN